MSNHTPRVIPIFGSFKEASEFASTHLEFLKSKTEDEFLDQLDEVKERLHQTRMGIRKFMYLVRTETSRRAEGERVRDDRFIVSLATNGKAPTADDIVVSAGIDAFLNERELEMAYALDEIVKYESGERGFIHTISFVRRRLYNVSLMSAYFGYETLYALEGMVLESKQALLHSLTRELEKEVNAAWRSIVESFLWAIPVSQNKNIAS